MGEFLIGYPNRGDDGTLSGGGWASGLDLENLQDRRLAKVARSTDATTANTQLENDLGGAKLVRAVGLHNHNLSLAANVRIRGWTHESSRSGAANYRDEDGVLTSQPTLEARHWHYQAANDGTTYRTTLLEGAGTNDWTRSEELDNAAWTKVRASVTADATTAPDGTTTADKLVEDATASQTHFVQRNAPATTDDTEQTVTLFAKAAEREVVNILTVLKDGTAPQSRLNVSTGAIIAVAGAHTVSVQAHGNGWYRIRITFDVKSGGSTPRVDIRMAEGGGVGDEIYNGDGSSGLYLWGLQFEVDQSFASSYIATTTAAASRDADLLQESDIGFTPADISAAGGLTVLSEWVELGTAFTGGPDRYWQIGGASAGTTPYFLLSRYTNDGSVRAQFDDGSGPYLSDVSGSTVSLFDHVRARTVLYLDGSTWKIQLHVSVNGGAETSATAATIGSSLPAAWSANTLTVGAAPGDTLHGYAGHIRHVFAEGEKTLTEMEALEAGDNGVLYHWEAYDSQWQSAFPTAYPSGTKLWGKGVGGGALRQEDLDALERIDYVDVLPKHVENRYWTVEIDDTSNSDGYVEFGRLHLSPAYEPSHSFSTGAEIGWQTSSRSTETEGGSFIHEQRPRRRVVNVTHQDIEEDEALVQVFEAIRRLGTTEQFLFVWADDDTTHLFRRSFLAVLQDLDLLQYPNVGAYADQAWSIVEEI